MIKADYAFPGVSKENLEILKFTDFEKFSKMAIRKKSG